ncbi:poly(ADP-ribose) glycohydrolase, variant 1 [Capsaspora owczarzaki ATCC 30864]|uniref:poly(ADP-ribose) glycohydrolase n=1 Tax=Capsaspora owczarzaki (strain ATCC 30864) TaxID=595528 RepID=A0A0D2X2C5_CAPO3|nr:poly(ADP-ribose) glycohydrolase, variant 1 [Capsaspora owczarzaki ATCC 30864]
MRSARGSNDSDRSRPAAGGAGGGGGGAAAGGGRERSQSPSSSTRQPSILAAFGIHTRPTSGTTTSSSNSNSHHRSTQSEYGQRETKRARLEFDDSPSSSVSSSSSAAPSGGSDRAARQPAASFTTQDRYVARGDGADRSRTARTNQGEDDRRSSGSSSERGNNQQAIYSNNSSSRSAAKPAIRNIAQATSRRAVQQPASTNRGAATHASRSAQNRIEIDQIDEDAAAGIVLGDPRASQTMVLPRGDSDKLEELFVTSDSQATLVDSDTEAMAQDDDPDGTLDSDDLMMDDETSLLLSRIPSAQLERSSKATVVAPPSPEPTPDSLRFPRLCKQLQAIPPSQPVPIASTEHDVLVDLAARSTRGARPVPSKNKAYVDAWDADHVRLPCSPENLYPLPRAAGESTSAPRRVGSRWDMIVDALKQPLGSTYDLEEAILTYNQRYANYWNFRGLHDFFANVAEDDEKQVFFATTLPFMVDLALSMPQICTAPIPLLKQQKTHAVTMSQQQAACLLANAFFCTFPRRNTTKDNSEYSNMPDINFNTLFASVSRCTRAQAAKLRCLFHYFERVRKQMPTGTLTFERQLITASFDWASCTSTLTKLLVRTTGTIEDDAPGLLQLDFANKCIGGGVIAGGAVQEEIRFMICPEMIVSLLITEILEDNECLIMTGHERFSNYTGYSSTFTWAGDHVDTTDRDDWARRMTQVVAIDALVFSSYARQFKESPLVRELNKALVGFLSPLPSPLPAIATGKRVRFFFFSAILPLHPPLTAHALCIRLRQLGLRRVWWRSPHQGNHSAHGSSSCTTGCCVLYVQRPSPQDRHDTLPRVGVRQSSHCRYAAHVVPPKKKKMKRRCCSLTLTCATHTPSPCFPTM